MFGNKGGLMCGLLTCLVLAASVMGCGKAAVTDGFSDKIGEKIGDHIYCFAFILEDPDKDRIIDDLKTADKKMNEDICVVGYKYIKEYDKYRFYARQCVNGAVIPEIVYDTDLDDHEPHIVLKNEVTHIKDLDTSGVISPVDLIPAVREEAAKHTGDLNDYDEKGIYGTYLLSYDRVKGILIYDFTVNETSHVMIDARSGAIIEESFWDGAIMD